MPIPSPTRNAKTETTAIASAPHRNGGATVRRADASHPGTARSTRPTFRIPAGEFDRLRKLALFGPAADGAVNAVFMGAARDGDTVVIPFRPESAAGLVAWMRRADVDFRGDALAVLGAHADAVPAAASIAMDPAEYRAILRFLDSVASLNVRDASPAADFLRAAKVVDGAVAIRITPAQAARLAPVLTAAGARADLVAETTRIAGSVEAGRR